MQPDAPLPSSQDSYDGTPTLDDALEADRRRDEGMQVASWSTDIAWIRACDTTIELLAETGRPFDSEDVRRLVGPPVGSPNALGARFAAAARRGVIEPAGWTIATRPEAHGRGLRRWRGRLAA